MTSLFRCAHISDLHFAKPSWGLSQFFSKRWLGNLNLMLSRHREYAPENLYSLIDTFNRLGITHVFITGDVSTTSAEAEFGLAMDFVATLKKAGFKTFVLPGNHDQYTRQAYRDQIFYQFFDTGQVAESHPIYAFNLKKDGLAAANLGHKWWLIMLDTAIATSLLSSCGLFSSELENKLQQALTFLPEDQNIILANHFPFFQNDNPRKILKRAEALKNIIQRHPNIRLYLHGHTHRHCVADLRSSGLPIILDSGSTARKSKGSWNLIDIGQDTCSIEPFFWQKDKEVTCPLKDSPTEGWISDTQHGFKW